MIYVEDKDYIDDYRKVGVSTFLFALEDYCVGYKTLSLEEIEKIDVSNKFLLLNRVLDCRDIDKLKDLLKNIQNIKGLVFEDLGVYQLAKKMHLNVELILFQNHFGTNIRSLTFWEDKVSGVFVSNELTYDELAYISDHCHNLCLHLYGYNQVMYSRRLLLSNWSEEFNIPFKKENIIEETATKVRFRAYENEYGTIMYSEKVFNGQELLKLDNIKYFYVNPFMIPHQRVLNYLKTFTDNESDKGFLNKKTIYKLKER